MQIMLRILYSHLRRWLGLHPPQRPDASSTGRLSVPHSSIIHYFHPPYCQLIYLSMKQTPLSSRQPSLHDGRKLLLPLLALGSLKLHVRCQWQRGAPKGRIMLLCCCCTVPYLRPLCGLLQVLLQHIHGRQWRRSSLEAAPEQHTEVAQLLAWFWDSPAAEHPFSLQNFVTGGKRDGSVL